MHSILADSIGPGLFWILVLLATVGGSILALTSLVPAAMGRLRPTLVLTAPAFGVVVFTTSVLLYFWFKTPNAPGETPEDWRAFKNVWLVFCGVPFALGALAILLALFRSSRVKPLATGPLDPSLESGR